MTTTQTTFDNASSGGATSDRATSDRATFGGHMMSILTGSLLSSMVDIGHRTGLFAAAAEGPATSEQLAARAGLCERYVREWLGAVTTGGIVEYDEDTEAFFLPPEHAALLTTPGRGRPAGGGEHRARRAPPPDRAGLPGGRRRGAGIGCAFGEQLARRMLTEAGFGSG